ncbi:MAG: hypothetical protein OEW66_00865 [Actinomycetota bacterium]|nr:hypothetical protein [Actinomycetota bacterium]MDH5312378.1 hypothetical protein [Actinomycetota bacterium]
MEMWVRPGRSSLLPSLLMLSVGSFLAGLGVALLAWASTELRGGLADVASHWWSGLALAVCIVGLGMVVVVLSSIRSADPPSDGR